jgi:hypothetical protein
MQRKPRSAARKPPSGQRRTVSSPAQLSFDFTASASLVPLVISTPLQRELLARALERIAKKENDPLLEAAVLPQDPLSLGTACCYRAPGVPYSVSSYYRCASFHPETITMTVSDPGPRSPRRRWRACRPSGLSPTISPKRSFDASNVSAGSSRTASQRASGCNW